MFPHVRNDNRADAGLQWVLSRNLFPPVEKEELGGLRNSFLFTTQNSFMQRVETLQEAKRICMDLLPYPE